MKMHIAGIKLILCTFCIIAVIMSTASCQSAPVTAHKGLRFTVHRTEETGTEAVSGRLFLILSGNLQYEPRYLLPMEDLPEKPHGFGVDVKDWLPGPSIVFDGKAPGFPALRLSDVEEGYYLVQSVLMKPGEILDLNAPGNMFSDVQKMHIDPQSASNEVSISLNHIIPEETPKDSEFLKFIKIKSDLLSTFHGKPFYLRAGVILPRNFYKNPRSSFPLWLHIGGGGDKYTTTAFMMQPESGYWEIPDFSDAWNSEDAPQMIFVHLDNRGPYGCPYFVNSENNGPYGDAIVKELIPYIESHFRGKGDPLGRFVEGRSTGGWSALALQIFYPDFFNGAWAGQPDPVDFRAFVNINIYSDENAFVDEDGDLRSSSRNRIGVSTSTVRDEIRRENILGLNGTYTMSGGSWGAWNAVFAPRGADGNPRPLWDPSTGAIDHEVAEHYRKYDLRNFLSSNWKELGTRLKGKIHIWVGEMDTYYLDRAVHLLDNFLSKAQPPYDGSIHFGPLQDHTWSPRSAQEIMTEMQTAYSKTN